MHGNTLLTLLTFVYVLDCLSLDRIIEYKLPFTLDIADMWVLIIMVLIIVTEDTFNASV